MSEDTELPAGWSLQPLGEAADATLGKTPRRIDYRNEGVHRLVKYRDLKTGNIDFDETTDAYVADDPESLKGLRELKVGDVLIGASGHDGASVGRKLALVDALPQSEKVFFVGELFRIRPRGSESDPRWFFHYFSSRAGYGALQSAVTGGHLTNGRARQLVIPLAPPDVQRRISDVLDTVRSKERSVTNRLAATRNLVDLFRQAVLAAACSGRLTADWREKHEPPAVSDLLSQMRRDRQPAQKARTSVQPPDARLLDELPPTWSWASVGEIGDVELGGTPSRKEARYWDGDVPWVSSGEVANCRISGTRERITEGGLANSSAKLYPAGTVLIAMIGEGKTRGQSAILDIAASTNQNAAGVLPHREIVNPEYVWRWALAQYEVTRAVGRGGNQPALNKQKVRGLAISVPPLEEQDEIVRRVDELLGLADGLALRIVTASMCLTQSSQAVLDKAFRGDLSGPLAEEKTSEPGPL